MVKKSAPKKKASTNKPAAAVVEEATTELRLVEVVELFTVSPGVLMSGLGDDQYRRRKARLTLVDGEGVHSEQSVYNSDESLQFKVGERLMLEYDAIHKTHRGMLNLVN